LTLPVSLVRCKSYDPDEVRSAVRESLEPLGGMASFVRSGQNVLLKPNLLTPQQSDKAVTTHPEFIRAVAMEAQEAGGHLFLGDSPAFGTMGAVLSRSGVGRIVKELGITVVPFKNPVTLAVPDGIYFKTLEIAEESQKFDVLINLPKLKTHTLMLLTLAVKNLFGTVVGVSKTGWHLRAKDDWRFADLLLDVARLAGPDLNILDGILGMEGNGPNSGDPAWTSIVAASPSAIALDQVVASALGAGPEKFMVLARAQKQGLEGSMPEQVKVIGLPAGEAVAADFRLPDTARSVDFMIPSFIRGRMRQSLSSYPMLDPGRCTSCGACRDTCPVSAISLHDGGGGDVDRSLCISCFCCQEICPEWAIDPVDGKMLKIMKKMGIA